MTLQSTAKLAEQDSSMAAWTDAATATLARCAKLGNGDPELLLISARIWANDKNRERTAEMTRAALDAGFADPERLRNDTLIGAMIPAAELEPLLARAQENRKASEPALRAELRKERLDLPAPDFELAVLNDGRSVKLSDLKGKVVILDFWATWCGPCRKSIPHVQTFYERKLPNVEVFCVNVFERDGGVQVAPFWKDAGYPMPVLLGTQDTATSYGVRSIPTMFVIGPDGKIRYRHSGFAPDLAEKLQWMAEDAATP
jgi:thiol-disulfide isomerase/thioredoxin